MEVEYIEAKSILSPKKDNKFWFGYDYNMNIYRGCSHGCIYCDSRSMCYRIEKFEKIQAKKDVLPLLEKELARKRIKGVIGTGSMSDPYNPLERKLELTRGALKLVNEHGYGIAIFTKSDLIKRDIDILVEINKTQPVLCAITITTIDENLAKLIEPKVSTTQERFQTIRELSQAGIYSGVILMPVLPYITDNRKNISGIVELAHENGAKFIYGAMGMTMRDSQRDYYFKKLDEFFPGIKEKYIKAYKNSYSINSKNYKELWKIYTERCKHLNICYKMKEIIKGYKKIDNIQQLKFF